MASFSELQPSENRQTIVSAKVVCYLPKEQEVPLSFLVVDYKYVFSVVSLYHTNKTLSETVKAGDEFLIKNPNMIYTSLEYKGRLYTFQTIKVTEISDILLNG